MPIRVHQTVHGYDRGHRELASSVAVAPAGRHAMLVLSDLSGPRPADRFETYVTAYPVPASDFYALARTWLAPEMPRPGCVWTHSLLIPRDALSRLSFRELNRLFRRPTDSGRRSFSGPVDVEPAADEGVTANLSASWSELVSVVYSRGDPIAVSAESSDDLEMAIGDLWDSQWPALKSRFSFSTGSFAPRTLEGLAFDLQVVPTSVAPMWPWDVLELKPKRRSDGWVQFAMRDLRGLRELPALLDDIGSTARTDLRPLATTLALAREARTVTDTMAAARTVLDMSASSVRARTLVILLSSDRYWPYVPLVSRAEAALLLPETGELNSILPEVAKQMAGRISRASRIDAWALARDAWRRPTPNPLAEALLEGVASALDAADLLTRGDSDKGLALRLVELNPRLAASPQLWKTSSSSREALFTAVARGVGPDAEALRLVLASVVASGSTEAIHDAHRRWPEALLRSLLDAIDAGEVTESSPAVLRAILKENAPTVIESLRTNQSNSRLRRLAALSLGPDAVDRLRHPLAPWLELDLVGLRGAAFLFAIGLRSEEREAVALVQRTFSPLNEAAARGRLPDDTWQWLETFIPSIGFRDWDRCERLRRAVAGAFVSRCWPVSTLLDLADKNASRRQLLRSLRHVDGGKAYARASSTEIKVD